VPQLDPLPSFPIDLGNPDDAADPRLVIMRE
jgi:hypothetical protein